MARSTLSGIVPVALLAALAVSPTHARASKVDGALLSHLQANPGTDVRVIVLLKDLPKYRVHALTAGMQVDRAGAMQAFMDNAREAQEKFFSEMDLGLASSTEPAHRYWIINGAAMTVRPEQVDQIAARSDVRGVFLNETIQLDFHQVTEIPKREREILEGRGTVKEDGDTAQFTYGLMKLNVPQMRDVYHLSGNGVVVGILDTGYDKDHPDLAGKLIGWKDFTGSNSEGVENAYDDHGHGTHVAGTIGGSDTSGLAIGVAPNAKMIAGKVFSASGGATSEGLLAAMEWIVDPDGDPQTDDAPALVSNSWGGGPGRTVFLDSVKKWVALGVFPCFAAGNSGPGVGTVGTPGGFLEAFAVGATDQNDGIASFSSRGPVTWDGQEYTKPDVSAPGKDVTSAKPGGGYQAMSGTSMATPHVSGLLALLYEANPGMTIDQARDLLERTSKDLGEEGKDNTFGAGRVDALAASAIVVSGGKVFGKLTNSATGAGVAGIITVAENGLRIKTDRETGAYQVVLPEGTYTLEAKSFGYVTASGVTVTVQAQGQHEVNVNLTPAATGKLVGKVVSQEAGEPLSARIAILDTPLDPVGTQDTGVFAIDLPAGSYRLMVTAFAYDPMETQEYAIVAGQTTEIEVALTHVAPILVIADDNKKGYDAQYRSALEAIGRRFGRVESEALGANMTGEFLSQYETLVWLTGDQYSETVTEQDQTALKAFLDNGGRLFISGQDIGYELKEAAFYTDYLHSKFVADTADSKEVSGDGLSFKIEGGDGANNQRYPDKIETREGGTALLTYGNNQGPAAVVGAGGAGRVVYFAFGFEAIDTADGRKATMEKVLQYLESSVSEKAARARLLSGIGSMKAAGQALQSGLVERARSAEGDELEALEAASSDLSREARRVLNMRQMEAAR